MTSSLIAQPLKRARVTSVETPYKHALHAYQGLCPWSPDGSQLLYVGFSEVHDEADIVIRDLATGRDTLLGKTHKYDYHTAAYQQWGLDGQCIVYDDMRDGLKSAVLADASGSGQSRCIKGMHVRAVSPSGLRGYGGLNVSGLNEQEPSAVGGSENVAARLDLASGKVETLFSTQEAARHLPEELVDPACGWAINHCVANADESRVFFKLVRPDIIRTPPDQMDIWGGFFTYDINRSEFHCFGHRISGHPQWMPDGRHIINVMQPLDGSDNRWLVLQDTDTGDVERLVDWPIEGPGHPVISPDGRYLATDAYTANRLCCPVYVIELETGICREIARFEHHTKVTDTYQPHTLLRSNLHPVWSPDSRSLLVNVNDGASRLGMYLLEDFLD